MITNPIYKRDLKLSNKNIRIALAVGIFNLSILMFALSNIDKYISDAALNARIDYNDFLNLFMILLCMDFTFIFLILPGFTVCLFVITTLPVKLISLIYTTLSVDKVITLIASYAVSILYVAAIGIFVSSVCKKSSIAIEVVYVVLIVLILLSVYNFENMFFISPVSLLLLNLYNISKYNYVLNNFGIYLIDPENIFSMHNIRMTLTIQLFISLILVVLSVYNTDLRHKNIFSLWKKDK